MIKINKSSFIIDTSCLIAYLANEKEADEVSRFLPRCEIPFICLSELYYVIWLKKGRADADKIYGIVKGWGLSVVYPEERIILQAGRIKAVHRLGISDSYIAACSLVRSIPLLTKDKDYLIIEKEIELQLI